MWARILFRFFAQQKDTKRGAKLCGIFVFVGGWRHNC